MLRTDILTIKDVPSTWIFEFYCNLNMVLIGQDVSIKSMFNPNDKIPSMKIYIPHEKNSYKFKDFSSGKGGDGINLVQDLYDFNYIQAVTKILKDYEDFTNGRYIKKSLIPQERYKVDLAYKRSWNNLDVDYWWGEYEIGGLLLKSYNIWPLEGFTMKKEKSSINITGDNLYGYYKNDGTLYKIYQPFNERNKFLKKEYFLQGSEQLHNNKNRLIITSSMKDGLCLVTMGLKIDFIAPESENIILKKDLIEKLSRHYPDIYTLFDNDAAGIQATEKYNLYYNIPSLGSDELEKDVARSVKRLGKDKTINIIKTQLKNGKDIFEI